MNRLRGLGVALILFSGTACSLTPPDEELPEPPSELLRAEMAGGVSLRIDEPLPVARIQVPPRGWCEGACTGAAAGSLMAAASLLHPVGILAIPFVLPPCALGFGIYGIFAALPADEVDKAAGVLEAAALDAPVARILGTHLARGSEEHEGPIVAGPQAPMELRIARPEAFLFGNDFDPIFDPVMQFTLTVNVQLSRSEGETVYRARFRYDGGRGQLQSWAAEDGARFRRELREGAEVLGRRIAEYLFFTVPLPPRRLPEPAELLP